MLKLEYGSIAGKKPFHAALVASRGRAAKIHSHRDFGEVMHVTGGAGTHFIGNDRQSLHAGDTVFVRSHDRHALESSPKQSLTIINVAFPTSSIAAFFEACGLDPVPWMKASEPPIARAADNPTARARVVAEFERTLQKFQSGPRGLDLVSLLSVVFGELERSGIGQPEALTAPEWLRSAATSMNAEQNLRNGIPRLLELSGVSHSHLAREFQNHFGRTPGQFVNSKRLDLASTLLVTSTDPIGLVAERCGFASSAYFIHLFKNRFGTTPLVWRTRSASAVMPASVRSRS